MDTFLFWNSACGCVFLGLSCSTLRHQNAACVCWHKASRLQLCLQVHRHTIHLKWFTMYLQIWSNLVDFMIYMMNVCKWMEMLTLLQAIAASICLIDEGSSSQALGMIRPLHSNVAMYLHHLIGQWKTVAKGTFLLVGPGWCDLSCLLNLHSHLPRLRWTRVAHSGLEAVVGYSCGWPACAITSMREDHQPHHFFLVGSGGRVCFWNFPWKNIRTEALEIAAGMCF